MEIPGLVFGSGGFGTVGLPLGCNEVKGRGVHRGDDKGDKISEVVKRPNIGRKGGETMKKVYRLVKARIGWVVVVVMLGVSAYHMGVDGLLKLQNPLVPGELYATITMPAIETGEYETAVGVILTAIAAIWIARKFIKLGNRS